MSSGRAAVAARRLVPGRVHVAFLVLALAARATAAQAPPHAAKSKESFGQRFVAGRLSLGLQFTHFWLIDDRRSGEDGYDNDNSDVNFLGSLWGLDPVQHAFPTPSLEYRVAGAVGIGAAYDESRARTLDWANDDKVETAGDGDLEIRGVQVYLFARFRSRARVVPYAALGWGFYRSRFFATPEWAIPGRRFEVDDTDGWFGTAGLEVRAGRGFHLGAGYRYSGVDDVQARAYLRPNRFRPGAFPMKSHALTLGLRYGF